MVDSGDSAADYVLAVADAVCTGAGLVAVVGNGLVLALFASNRHVASRAGIDAIVPLAMSDFCMGVGCFVGGAYRMLYVAQLVSVPSGVVILSIWTPLTAGAVNSLLLAVAIAIDRLLAINRPFSFIKSNHNEIVAVWSSLTTAVSVCVQIAAFVGPDLFATAREFSPVGVWTTWYSRFYPSLLVAVSLGLAVLFVAVIITMYKAEKHSESLYASTTATRYRLAEQRHITRLSATAISVCIALVTLPYLGYELVAHYFAGRPATLTAYGSVMGAAAALNAALNTLVYALRYEPIRAGVTAMLRCRRVVTRLSVSSAHHPPAIS